VAADVIARALAAEMAEQRYPGFRFRGVI